MGLTVETMDCGLFGVAAGVAQFWFWHYPNQKTLVSVLRGVLIVNAVFLAVLLHSEWSEVSLRVAITLLKGTVVFNSFMVFISLPGA